MKRFFYSLFSTLLSTFCIAQQLLRFPAINHNGSLIAFSYQGDIWTASASGGIANRLTIHEGYEANPVFSPDGKYIAFSGARFGNNDLFKIPVEGGTPVRLTYHSAGDNISSWNQLDKILFSTNREYRQIERPSEVYGISPNGGTESRELNAVGFDPVYSPNGRFIAFVRGDINPIFRHEYKGSSDRDLWIYDTKNKSFHELAGFETNDILPKWSGNNTIYFLSSEAGAYNIYRLRLTDDGKNSGKPIKLTNAGNESIRHFDISRDGTTLIYEQNMSLFKLSTQGGSAQKLNIEIHADDRYDAFENKTLNTGLNQYAVSPNGKLWAFTIRGEIFIKEADKEKTRSINVSDHAYRDIDPVWLNDSVLLFSSDRRNGNFDIFMVHSSDTSESNIFKSLKHVISPLTSTSLDEKNIVVSNDNKKITFTRGRNGFFMADIDSTRKLVNEIELSQSNWTAPSQVSFSPDNKWIAYTLTDLEFNQDVFIQPVDRSIKPVNISMHPRTDANPIWSADGSKLGFTGARSTTSGSDVYFVWLKKEDWEKSLQDWRESDAPAESASKNDKKPKPLKIDVENIYQRIVQVTNQPGNEGNVLISKDGEIFYFTANNSDARGRDLYSIKWDGRELKEITKGGSNPTGLTMDKDGKYIYFTRTNGAMSRLDPKSGTTESLPYTAKLKIDYEAERTQVFEEAWRTIRDGFYDPQFHGHDWHKLHDQYKERCVKASTSSDFRDMFNWLLGELNSSHQALTAADRTETNRDATGLLGVELIPIDNGVKVIRTIPGTAADKISSKLMVGDIINKVNGEPVTNKINFYSLLSETVGEKVILTIQDKTGKEREVIIRPQASITDALYDEWVDDRKKLVANYSNGKLGYIHIRSMDFASFEVVEREFTAAGYGKQGLIIDVRYNGGGSTTDYLMTILNYKQHAYTIPRGAAKDLEKEKKNFRGYYPIGERLVFAAWTKPSIALCNEGSYSNAEIFSHAYKGLAIGKLIGVPTNGSVISTGGQGLMDGSFVRLPFRGWFNKVNDRNQELGAAIPDIIIQNSPDWISKNTDDQLKKAVEELLKAIN